MSRTGMILMFIVILLVLASLVYFIVKRKKSGLIITSLLIIGMIIGIPMSYYFQTDWLQNSTGSIAGYFEYFTNPRSNQTSESHVRNLLSNIITSITVCGIIGVVLGIIINRTRK